MQSRNQSIIVRLSAILAATLSLAALSGCSVAADAPPQNYVAPIEMAGLVLAGRNYMEYAKVKVYETQPNGVATNGIYVGQAKVIAQATTSITGTWTVDNVTCASPDDQVYVTAEGGTPMPYYNNFTSLTNNPNSLMMTAVGPCSTLTNETNPRNVTQIITNEASSVAAVWALRPFISFNGTTVNITSDATNYSGTSDVGVIGNYAGLAHAFLNAVAIEPFRQGAFSSFTNGANGYMTGGMVSVQTLNALAYMQYLCTIGATDGKTAGNFDLCTSTNPVAQYLVPIVPTPAPPAPPFTVVLSPGLYPLATPPGGTTPTNSLQAMWDIANNPTNNAQALMNFAQSFIPGSQSLKDGNGNPLLYGGEPEQNYGQTYSSHIGSYSIGPFVPAATSFCATLGSCDTNDWTVANYYGPGIGGNTSTTPGQAIQPSTVPIDLSIDANDNIYFSNPSLSSASTQGNVMSLNSTGQYRWGSLTDFSVNVEPRGMAVDQSGNLWVASLSTLPSQTGIQQFDTATGALKNTYLSHTAFSIYDVAVDSLGNVWFTNNSATSASLHELRADQNYAEFTFPIAISPAVSLQLRPDSNNNIWAAGYSNADVIYLANTSGSASAPTYTQGTQTISLGSPQFYGIAVDAAGNAYAAGSNATAGLPGTLYKITVTNPTSASATLSATTVASIPVVLAADTYAPAYMDTDGVGTIWLGNRATGTQLYDYVPSTNTISGFYPCFANTTQSSTGSASASTSYCGQSAATAGAGSGGPTSGISTRINQAIDSTGSLWVASYGNSGGGRMVQVLGVAAPTVPLKALGKIGVMP